MGRYTLWCCFVILLLQIDQSAWANKIDSLRTDAQVVEFLKSINENFRSSKYNKIELRSTETLRKEQDCDGIAELWQVNNWEKADFNGDGHTDLLVTLYWYDYGVYAVMDRGNNKFELITIPYNIHDPCKLAKSIVVGGKEMLLFYGRKPTRDSVGGNYKAVNQVDTLVYRSGDFVELNSNPASLEIDSVQFDAGYCFGSCPVFKISFDKSGHAVYDAGSYNPKQGKFSTTLKKKDLQEIIDLINYLGVANLKDDYSVSWTDDQPAHLRVKFKDGTIKQIRDYGMRGTFGLRLLYNKFFALRTNQEWGARY